MPRLHQILAIARTAQAQADRAITDIHHLMQNETRFEGLSKTYLPVDEDGDRLPPESTPVQLRAEELFAGDLRSAWTRLLDLTLTKDVANTHAKADIKVGDTVIAAGVPVTYLLTLSRQLQDLYTVVAKMPVLHSAFTWSIDPDGNWATEPIEQAKTKKTAKVLELSPATKEHPAQVQLVDENPVVGYWTTTRRSGAIPAARQRALLARITALQEAVKIAKEEANSAEITDQHIGASIFDYVLA